MKIFQLGLSLAGTVSAGPYTAGVIDFILEALEEWELEKEHCRGEFGNDQSKWTVPSHEVHIKSISGASGGGIITGLFLNSLGKLYEHVRTPQSPGKATDNDFYHNWVNLIGFDQLVNSSDLDGGELHSLLNDSAFSKIASEVFQLSRYGASVSRAYIDPNLQAFITLSNLRGIPYYIDFRGEGTNRLFYYRHTDYAAFEYSRDTISYPDRYQLSTNTGSSGFAANYQKLREACLATCAVPIGFKPRIFTQPVEVYAGRKDGHALAFPPGLKDYDSLDVDGALFNNRPLELARKALISTEEPEVTREAADVTRAVVMVSPLETAGKFRAGYDLSRDGLLDVIPQLLTSLRDDAMFSDEELSLAFDEGVYSRFIITPTRNAGPGTNEHVSPAITASMLSAFGAFLSRDFREHDYFLGRRNGQRFLQQHFSLPYASIKTNPAFAEMLAVNPHDRYQFTKKDLNGKQALFFPVIPLCGRAALETYFPMWPYKKGYDLSEIQSLIRMRCMKMVNITQRKLGLKPWERLLSNLFIGLGKKATDTCMSAITKGLSDYKL